MVVAAFGIMKVTTLEVEPKRYEAGWLRKNYIGLVIAVAAIVAVSAIYFYLFGIGVSLSGLVARLRMAAIDKDTNAEDIRNLGTTVALLMGVLAAAATIIFSIIRIWINERTATATEEGLITDRISKAVEGLGAEKEVNWIGRTFKVWTGEPTTHNRSYLEEREINRPERSQIIGYSSGTDFFYDQETDDHEEKRCGFVEFKTWPSEETRIQRHDQNAKVEEHERVEEFGDWQVFRSTEPNLEVRVGAIYALERIAQDSLRDHVQIMEILCAYIRENAPLRDTPKNPFEIWEEKSEQEPQTNIARIPNWFEMRSWGDKLPKPRTDIQVALEVIGRRKPRQIKVERGATVRGSQVGYRLDLRESCLQAVDISELDFSYARFENAQMQWASLTGAALQEANLTSAQLQAANLTWTKLQGANLTLTGLQAAFLSWAQLQGANLRWTKLQGAQLSGAQLQGADLTLTKLQWTDTSEAVFGTSTPNGEHTKSP